MSLKARKARQPRALFLSLGLLVPLVLHAAEPVHAQQPQQPAQAPAAEQAQQPTARPTPQQMRQMMQKLAAFRHEPLTVEKAKAAIEVFMTLREKYPPETFRSETPGPMGAVEAMKRSEKAREIMQLVREKGFSGIDQWAKTFTSLGMALAYVREGDDNAEKKLKEVQASPMPDDIKQRIVAMLKAVIPPKENAEVARKLLADEQTKKMIELVEKPR